jgi:hypothetical protein
MAEIVEPELRPFRFQTWTFGHLCLNESHLDLLGITYDDVPMGHWAWQKKDMLVYFIPKALIHRQSDGAADGQIAQFRQPVLHVKPPNQLISETAGERQ